MKSTRRTASLAAAAMLAVVPIADAAKKKPPVKAPKSGQYSGMPRGRDLTLYVSGKSIQIVAFSFACADTAGRTSLNDIRLKKTSKGYKFALNAHGNISFKDEQPDENGTVAIAGRFTRDGKRAKGTFRVKSQRCGNTGNVEWRAKR
jgi:hypothetical protein